MPDGPSGLDNPVASVDQEGNVSGGEMFTGGHGDWRMGPLPIQLSKAASLSLSPTVSLQQELSPSHPPWFLPLLAEDPGLLSRPCRNRRPSDREDGGVSGVYVSEGRVLTPQVPPDVLSLHE